MRSCLRLILLGAWVCHAAAGAATITVDTLADDFEDNGNCSLQEAVFAANNNVTRDSCAAGATGPDTIMFAVSGVIELTLQGQPGVHVLVQEDLAVNGNDQITVQSTFSGAAPDIFTVSLSSGDVDLSFESIVINGTQNPAIREETAGRLFLNNATINGPVSAAAGDLEIALSTITGNVSGNAGNLTVSNSEIIGPLNFTGDLGAPVSASLTNSVFRGDSVALFEFPMITVDGCQFLDSTASAPGLGVVNSSLTLTGSTLSGHQGGALSISETVNAASPITDFFATVRNSTLANSTFGRGVVASASADATLSLTIEDTTISNHSAGQRGAGLSIGNNVSLALRRSQVSGNNAGSQAGGGLDATGFAVILVENSTFSGNQSSTVGAGVHLTVNEVTFINNTVAANVGPNGAFVGGNVHRVANNIFAGTTDSGASDDLRVAFQGYSGGFNLVENFGFGPTLASDLLGANPDLMALADNGGPTLTHALGGQSEAINGGSNTEAAALSADQRGEARVKNGVVDIGAFESDLLPPGAGSIGDLVFQDFDGNGALDGADTGFPGIQVELYRDDGSNNGALDEGDTLIEMQASDAMGAYDFQNLSSGSYLVNVPAAGNNALIGAQLTAGSNPLAVTLGVDQDFDDADFGFDPAALVLAEGVGNTNLPDQFAGTAGVVALHFSLTASSENTVVVERLNFDTRGDGNDESDLGEVSLYLDSNGDGLLDGGEPRLSGPQFFAADNGSVTFIALERPIPAGQTEHFILTIDLGQSACLCEDYRPRLDGANVTARIQGGPPVDVAGVADGRFIEIAGGDLVIDSGNNQNGLVGEPLPEDMVVQVSNQFPDCGGVEFSIRQLPMSIVEGLFANGQQSINRPLTAGNLAAAGFTFGKTGGSYALRAQIDTEPAGCTVENNFVDFSHTAAGIALTDTLMAYRADEDTLRTFVQTIEAQNQYSVTLAPENLPGFTLESVTFELAGQSQTDASAPFQGTLDMQDVMARDQLAVTLTVTLPSGKRQTAQVKGGPPMTTVTYPVEAIPIPSWFDAVAFIAEGLTAEFDAGQRKYLINFEYPTDFVWTDTVDTIVALLGGTPSELGAGGFRFMAQAAYDLDSNSELSAGIERDVVIFNRPVTLFGQLAAGFDSQFEFNSTTEPVGTLGARTAVDLGEKSFGRTVVVFGVPVTVALDLGGVAQIAATGRIYLNENLEFSQFLLSPEPGVQLDVAASVSALFGLAKVIASASPIAAAQIHLPYSTAAGLEFPRFGGRLTVDLAVEASVFYGLASAEVGSAMLGPYTWGDFISKRLDQRWARLQARKGLMDPESVYIVTHALAGDADGRAMLLLTQNVGVAGPDPELYFQYDDGSGFADPAPLRGTTAPDARWEMDPAVIFLSGGDALAVWTSNGGAPTLTQLGDIINGQEIAWSAFSDATGSWSAPADLTTDAAGDGSAQLTYDATGNRAVAVWVHDGNPDNDPLTRADWEIHSAVYTPASGTWSAVIPATSDSAADYMPALASQDGTVMAVWSEDADGALFVDPGLAPGADGTITDGSNLDPTNADARLVYATFDGTAWSAKQTLYASAAPASYTQMAAVAGYSGGRFVAVWVDKQATTDQLYWATFDGAWSSPQLLVESPQFIESPSVTVDDSNVATVVYRGYDAEAGDGNGYDGNLFSLALNLPTTKRATGKGAPQPRSLTDTATAQLFPVSTRSGGAIRLAWLNKASGEVERADRLASGATLQAGCSEMLIDADADTLIDRLDLTLDLAIASDGNYAVAGDLFDANGQFAGHAQGDAALLAAGNRSLVLSFAGAAISAGPGDGPFRLGNVTLQLLDPNAVVVDQAETACTTSALLASAFEPSPLRFDRSRYAPGSSAVVALELASANLDAGQVDNVAVRAWSNLDTQGITLTLTETEPDSGLFRGTLTLDVLASDDASDRLLAPQGAALVSRFEDPQSSLFLVAESLVGAELLFADGFER